MSFVIPHAQSAHTLIPATSSSLWPRFFEEKVKIPGSPALHRTASSVRLKRPSTKSLMPSGIYREKKKKKSSCSASIKSAEWLFTGTRRHRRRDTWVFSHIDAVAMETGAPASLSWLAVDPPLSSLSLVLADSAA